MRLSHSVALCLILLITSCGLVEPQDGTIKAFGTVIGEIPDGVEGLRLVIWYHDQLGQDMPGDPTHRVISEALIWADESFIANHHARGDSTTILTTFTLRPNPYVLSFEKVLPPLYPGNPFRYDSFESEDVTVLSRKELVVRLRGSFE